VKGGDSQHVAPDSDRRFDLELSRTPKHSRYKTLNSEQHEKFKKELSRPWKYDNDYREKIIPAPTPNCATSAKEIWEETTGEKINARVFTGHDTPEKLSKSISHLEKMDPTGKLTPPLYEKDRTETDSHNREIHADGNRRAAQGGGALPREAAPTAKHTKPSSTKDRARHKED
jgi:hypothetical protein